MEYTSTAETMAVVNALTEQDIAKVINEFLSQSVSYKSSNYLPKGTVFVLDHEEIRKTIPGYMERGRTVVYSSLDEDELRENGLLV